MSEAEKIIYLNDQVTWMTACKNTFLETESLPECGKDYRGSILSERQERTWFAKTEEERNALNTEITVEVDYGVALTNYTTTVTNPKDLELAGLE